MLYVQQSLGPDEELIHVGKFHWMYTVNSFLAIVWGLFGAIMIMFFAFKAYEFMGKLPSNAGFFEAIHIIHPLIRAGSFLFFVLGL